VALHELSRLTWTEVRALAGPHAVAVLPVGAVEAHGPHLPLGTDLIIADAMARAGGDRLAARGLDVLILPGLAYTAAAFAAGFAGTLSAAPAGVTALVLDVAAGLARHGVPRLALANAHLDPAHRQSLRAAVESAARVSPSRIIFPDVASRAWAARLGEEFRSGACHAGRYETSIVLAVCADLVRDETRRGLPSNPVSLSDAIAAGRTTFEDAGGPAAYFGDPAAATAEEGRHRIDELGAILEEAVMESVHAAPGAEPHAAGAGPGGAG
jgi:creatinine amidohydrolase